MAAPAGACVEPSAGATGGRGLGRAPRARHPVAGAIGGGRGDAGHGRLPLRRGALRGRGRSGRRLGLPLPRLPAADRDRLPHHAPAGGRARGSSRASPRSTSRPGTAAGAWSSTSAGPAAPRCSSTRRASRELGPPLGLASTRAREALVALARRSGRTARVPWLRRGPRPAGPRAGTEEQGPSMIRHVVLVRFRADVSEAERHGHPRRAARPARGPARAGAAEYRAFAWGPDVEPRGAPARAIDAGFTIDFADAAARDAYLVDPGHRAAGGAAGGGGRGRASTGSSWWTSTSAERARALRPAPRALEAARSDREPAHGHRHRHRAPRGAPRPHRGRGGPPRPRSRPSSTRILGFIEQLERGRRRGRRADDLGHADAAAAARGRRHRRRPARPRCSRTRPTPARASSPCRRWWNDADARRPDASPRPATACARGDFTAPELTEACLAAVEAAGGAQRLRPRRRPRSRARQAEGAQARIRAGRGARPLRHAARDQGPVLHRGRAVAGGVAHPRRLPAALRDHRHRRSCSRPAR